MNRESLLFQWAMVPAALLMAGLLAFSLARLRDDDPSLSGIRPHPAPPTRHPAADQTRGHFGWPGEANRQPMTNLANPFFTLAIQAAPPPPPPTPPPPPATRTVSVTYRGYLETSAGLRRALVLVDDRQLLVARGETVVANFAVADIELRHLSLTNAAGASVRGEFSKPVPVEVPAQ